MEKKVFVEQVMFSIRLNEKQTEKALRLGFLLKTQTLEDLQRKNQQNIAEVGKKALRLGIRDSAGNPITVGGKLIFKGYAKGKVENLSPQKSLQDLHVLKYKFSKIHLFQKEGQDSGFLRIYISKNPSSQPKVSPDQVLFLKAHFQRYYRMCVGFIHPSPKTEPPNVTFNFGGPMTDNAELQEKTEDLKDLRIISCSYPGFYKLKKAGK